LLQRFKTIELFAPSDFGRWILFPDRKSMRAGHGRKAMQVYEIRVLNDDLTTRAIVAQQYLNDGVAIRSARNFAEPHDCEVWRGLTCVYHTRPMPEH
jgi:hypothetical protein